MVKEREKGARERERERKKESKGKRERKKESKGERGKVGETQWSCYHCAGKNVAALKKAGRTHSTGEKFTM